MTVMSTVMEDTVGHHLSAQDVFGDDHSSSETERSESDDSLCLYDDADDLSLLEYARSHGLCTDYTSVSPLSLDVLGYLPLHNEPDDDNLIGLRLPCNHVVDEKLYLDKSSVLFLKHALNMANNDSTVTIVTHERRWRYKAELPLLSTDSELDLGRAMRKPNVDNAEDTTTFPRVEDDTGLDQELQWLDPDLLNTKNKLIFSEKLQMTASDTTLLLSVCLDPCYKDEEDFVITSEPENMRTKRPEHEMIPLLPPSSPYLPGIPESPIGHLEHTSSPPDPTIDELARIDDLVSNEALIIPKSIIEPVCESDEAAEERQMSPTPSSVASLLSSSPLKRRRPENFKEEMPLTPVEQSSSPSKKLKIVTFSEVLATTIPEHARVFLPDSGDVLHDDDDDFLSKTMKPIVHAAMLEAEHEQLMKVDSTMRVEVPILDHNIPPPPWDTLQYHRNGAAATCQNNLALPKIMLAPLKHDYLQEEKAWPGRVDKDVSWNPIPSCCVKDATKEQLDDGLLGPYLAALSFKETEIDSWKPEGLRTLDAAEDDDDELVATSFGASQGRKPEDMQALLEHRQQEIHEARQESQCSGAASLPVVEIESYGNRNAKDRVKARHNEPQYTNLDKPKASGMVGRTFSASTSLSRFMQAQIGTAPKVECTADPEVASSVAEVGEAILPFTNHDLPAQQALSMQCIVPIPEINLLSPVPQMQFILSSSLLVRRTLIRQIQQLYPAAQLIERDFGPQGTEHVDKIAINTGEADLILSPSTGLFFSTLQRIKQKPLPGQIFHTGIRERLASLACRYEQLVVLVSEGQPMPLINAQGNGPSRVLDERDCAALNSLTGYMARQGANVRILYVPGAEATLASWTVSCMKRYGLDDPEMRILQEETFWEVFLRRAGMNAFAAQAVLVKLKKHPEDRDDIQGATSGRNFGLQAFVQMHPEERRRHFSGLLGGSRILDLVGEVIGSRWGGKG